MLHEIINKLSNHDLVVGLSKIKFENDKICDVCQIGKQTKTSFKFKNHISSSRLIELSHWSKQNLYFRWKRYFVVVVDDYTRLTWFFATKDEALKSFSKLDRKIQNEKWFMVSKLEMIMVANLKMNYLQKVCDQNKIAHKFSIARTLQTNGVVERKISIRRTFLPC